MLLPPSGEVKWVCLCVSTRGAVDLTRSPGARMLATRYTEGKTERNKTGRLCFTIDRRIFSDVCS